MIHLDTLSTLVAATLVLLLGRKLVHSVSLSRNTPFLNLLPVACWWRWPCWC
jgi:sodium--glutamate symport carrier gltS